MQNTEELLEGLTSMIDEINEIPNTKDWYYNVVHECDLKICDLLHLLENGKFRSFELVRIAKEIKAVRQKRRIAKENLELLSMFINQLGKFQTDGGRDMLKQLLHKQYSDMNKPYNNRVYTEEEINNIVGGNV